MATYIVEVKAIGGWTTHSEWNSFRDAVDQADMIRGRVRGEREAWLWARDNQGFSGDYVAWMAQDDDEREAYEFGAAGV